MWLLTASDLCPRQDSNLPCDPAQQTSDECKLASTSTNGTVSYGQQVPKSAILGTVGVQLRCREGAHHHDTAANP